MSLAATTVTTLAVVDGPSLKRLTTPYEPQRFPACAINSKAHTWSPDNETLYIISSDAIHAFFPNTAEFKLLFNSPRRLSLQPVVVARDNSTIIFAQGSSIHVLALGSDVPKISNTLIGHSTSVVSLSLSNDASLLASSSTSGTLCVHNLSHNSLTVLKGLTASASSSKSILCMFHPHVRTRLLVGSGRMLTIYDTTRPLAPMKTIQLIEKENATLTTSHGQIVAISCSPFSKALAAVAFSSGMITLIDLDKDRALLKTLHIQTPVTSMAFTPDGVFLALGTENGKIILKEWRSSADDFRIINVDNENTGGRVMAISIQHRLKHSPVNALMLKATPAKPSTLSAPLAPYDLNNANGKSPSRRVTSKRSSSCATATPFRLKKAVDKPQRAFSPPKAPISTTDDDSGDISVQIDALMGDTGQSKKSPRLSPENIPIIKPRLSSGSSTSSLALNTASASRRQRSSSLVSPSSKTAAGVQAKSKTLKVASSSSNKSTTSSSSSNNGKVRVLNAKIRTTISSKLSIPTVNRADDPPSGRRVSTVPTEISSRTPTPELPSIDEQAPILKRTISVGMGIATPDVDRWLEVGRGPISAETPDEKVKHVGWAVSGGSSDGAQGGLDEDENSVDEDERTIPAGHLPQSTTSPAAPIRRPHVRLDSIQASPLRSSPNREGGGVPESVTHPANLIRALVDDIVHDYQRETREDIQGLHLDLLRMGRSWKHELRSLMEEYIGDLNDLREENKKLRKENDKLRRGF